MSRWLRLLALSPVAAAGADPSDYTLFNPVPRDQMRALSTDRPDQTESPFTVDAGHFQVEADLVVGAHEHAEGIDLYSLALGVLNLKAGLLNRVDFQFVLPLYTQERRTGPNAEHTERGLGDLETRVKVNLWGNDGGPTALALMPFVKWPTAASPLGNGAVEGGLIAPFGINLPAGWEATLMTELDVVQDEDGRGYRPDFVNSATVSHNLLGPVGAYVEFFTVASADSAAPWRGYFDLGFTWLATPNLQFDAGVNLGVTQDTADWQPFVGVTYRY